MGGVGDTVFNTPYSLFSIFSILPQLNAISSIQATKVGPSLTKSCTILKFKIKTKMGNMQIPHTLFHLGKGTLECKTQVNKNTKLT